VDKNLVQVKNKVLRESLRDDIYQLQLANSEEEFEAASALWLKKWQNNADTHDFIQYFKDEYFDKLNGWYEGRAPGYPSTNNSLEATNNNVKNECTLRERLPLGEFFGKSVEYVRQWSLDLDEEKVNSNIFALKPTIPLQLETAAYNWARSKVYVKTETSKGRTTHFIQPSNNPKRLTVSEIQQYERHAKRLSWKTFESYVKWQSQLWKVSMESNDWETASCSCRHFQKDFICKHTLGVGIRLKLYNVKPAAKGIPIGQKRKRGRPKKCTKALLRE